MAVIASERPGVFSSYETSSITYGGRSGGAVGLVAFCAGCEPGKVVSVTRMSSANLYFGSADSTSHMTALCETLLANGAGEIKAVAVNTDYSYAEAFALLEGEDAVAAVVCDSENFGVQMGLLESVKSASQNKRERIGVLFTAENTATRAKALNCERVVLLCQNGVKEDGTVLPGFHLAAALAAKAAMTGAAEKNFNGLRLSGITQLENRFSEEEIDDCIRAGITPLEVLSGGVEVIRAVTTRTSSNGVPDRTYRDLTTVLIIDSVIIGVRAALKTCLPGAHNNQRTRTAIATQAAVELARHLESGILDSFETPRVYPDPDDGGVCVVELSFTVARGINQIYITAHIKV